MSPSSLQQATPAKDFPKTVDEGIQTWDSLSLLLAPLFVQSSLSIYVREMPSTLIITKVQYSHTSLAQTTTLYLTVLISRLHR